MTPKRRVLVTGFKPFAGETINPSEILLEHIKKDFAVSGKLDTLVLPVSFSQSFSKLETQLEKTKYDAVFLLGQAGDRDKVCLERVALNWIETQRPDEDGYMPPQGAIESAEVPALFSNMPLTELNLELKGQGLPVKVSLSAGGYVCNYVYFKSLQKFQNETGTSVVFIHVPYLPQQIPGKPAGTPSLELDIMKKAVYAVLNRYV